MIIKKLAITAAICLTAAGWNAAHAQDRDSSSSGQQQDRFRATSRGGGGQHSRDSAGRAQDQRGAGSGGYNNSDSYRQRGQNGGEHSRAGSHSYHGTYIRSGRGHCRVQWRHHRRVRVCR